MAGDRPRPSGTTVTPDCTTKKANLSVFRRWHRFGQRSDGLRTAQLTFSRITHIQHGLVSGGKVTARFGVERADTGTDVYEAVNRPSSGDTLATADRTHVLADQVRDGVVEEYTIADQPHLRVIFVNPSDRVTHRAAGDLIRQAAQTAEALGMRIEDQNADFVVPYLILEKPAPGATEPGARTLLARQGQWTPDHRVGTWVLGMSETGTDATARLSTFDSDSQVLLRPNVSAAVSGVPIGSADSGRISDVDRQLRIKWIQRVVDKIDAESSTDDAADLLFDRISRASDVGPRPRLRTVLTYAPN